MTGLSSSGTRRARRAWAAALHKHVKRGHVYVLAFEHDRWCGIYTREQLCTCNPHRVLKDDAGRVLARIEGAGFFDQIEEGELLTKAVGGGV